MQNSSYLFTIQTNLQVYASNYNSIVWGAIYVNGQLASEADYTLVAPPHVASNGTELASSGEVVGVVINSTLPAGTTVSLAILCPTQPTMYVNNDPASAGTFEIAASTIPQTLPTNGMALPYNFDITGETF